MPYVPTRLGRWFYEERGASAPEPTTAIVCLHGLLFDGGMWRNQLGPLSELGRVIVFDGPGHGKSEVPPIFTLEEHADALADALAELGVEHALIAGLSWGGMLGMRFALRHPKQTLGLVLLDTSAEPEERLLRLRFRAFAIFHEHVGLPYAMYEKDIASRLFCRETRRRDPELVRQAGMSLLGFDRLGVARAAMAVTVNRTSVLDALSGVHCPTLVVCGREDRATPLAKSQKIAAHIAGAKLVVIPDAGHMSVLERPEPVNAAIVPFVRGVLESASATLPRP